MELEAFHFGDSFLKAFHLRIERSQFAAHFRFEFIHSVL